ncbi:MAG: hypothetical protein R2862_09960 [Thermoanaerobaculia bacterium]
MGRIRSPRSTSKGTGSHSRWAPSGRWRATGIPSPRRRSAYISDATGAWRGSSSPLEAYTLRRPRGRRRAAPAGQSQGTQLVVWRQDGRELFAAGGDGAIWSVPVERREGTCSGAPRRLFDRAVENGSFTVSDNGDRLLFFVDPLAARQTLTVVTNWPARREDEPR